MRKSRINDTAFTLVFAAIILAALVYLVGWGLPTMWMRVQHVQLSQIGTLVFVLCGASVVWFGLRVTYDTVYLRWHRWKSDVYELERTAQDIRLNSVRVLDADKYGRLGVSFDGTTYRNLDDGSAFTQELDLLIDPIRSRLDQQHKMLTAMTNVVLPQHYHISNSNQGLSDNLAALPEPITWPSNVRLGDVFQGRHVTTHDMVVGVRPGQQGLDVISDSIDAMTHVLVVGSSGWGKSTWLRAFLWQLAQCPESLECVAIDTSGSEFNILAGWDKLRYPVARNEMDAIAQLTDVSAEIERRKVSFEQYPLVTKLSEYNHASGQDLPRIFVIIDEGTSLLAQPTIGDCLRSVVQTSRQYGITGVLSGQSAHHRVVETQTRDNFSARVCFHTSPTSSRVVLDDSGASNLRDKGRFLAQLPGRDLVECQTPWIERSDFVKVLQSGKPAHETPVIEPARDDKVQQVIDLKDSGASDTRIAREVYGHGTSFYIDKVRHIIGTRT